MTTELSTPTDPPFATPAGRFGERSTHDVGPYAQPSVPRARHAVDAVLIDAIRATIGPFVPAPWRAGAVESVATPLVGERPPTVTSTPTVELPWIDTFLDDSPQGVAPETVAMATGRVEAATVDAPALEASSVEAEAFEADSLATEAVAVEAVAVETVAEEAIAVEAIAVEATVEDAANVEAADAIVVDVTTDGVTLEQATPTAESIAEAFAADESSAEPTAPPGDVWPLDEAGAAMRALAGEMPSPPQRAITPLYVPPVASTPPLPMWGDDDLMDIMPVRAPAAADVQEEHWAASARREAERAGNPEAAARALEDLARRVRAGELELPGYAPEMGDAAALAAALAALLGVRR